MTFEQAYTNNTILEKGQIVYSTDGKFYYLGNGVSSFRNILPLPVEKRKPVPEGEYRFNYPLLNIDGDVSVDRRLLHLEGREFIRKNVILLLDETISAGQTRTTIKVKPFKFDSERDEDDELRPEDILNIAKEQRFLITSLTGNTSVIEAAEDVEDLNVNVGAIDFVIEPKTFKNTYEKGSLIYFSGAALLNRLTDIELTARRYGRILANSFSIGYILEDINTFGGNEEDGEVLILPKSVETIRIYLFVKIKKGQDFYIESEDETYFITANEDAGPGEVELNITENNLPVSILAKQNDVIYLESSFLQGFLNVDPGKVQLGVQQQAKNNAIGQLKQVLLANADVPITTLPLFETKEGYLFHGQLIEVFDTTAEEREVYKFQVRALDGNLEPTVFVIPDTPNVVNVTIEPVFLTDNIGNIDGSWVAEEPKYSTMSRLNLNLQEFQLEAKNISANAQSIASVSGRVSNFEAETFITAQVTQVNGINVTETLAQIQLNADGTSQTSNIKLLASSIDVDGILKVTNSATFNPETNIAFTSYSVNFITTRPDSSALVVGDIWRRLTTSGGTEFVPYIYTATGWKINHTAIDAGNIITGTISVDRINIGAIGDVLLGSQTFIDNIAAILGDPDFEIGQVSIYKQTTAPVGTVEAPLKIGDIWIDITQDTDGVPKNYHYVYSDNIWVRLFSKIEGGIITTGSISVNKLGADIIESGFIKASLLNVNQIIVDGNIAKSDTVNVTIKSVTAPVIRSDGKPLQVGDLWTKPETEEIEGEVTEIGKDLYRLDSFTDGVANWVRAYTYISGGDIVTGTIDTDRLDVNQIITVGTIATQAEVEAVQTNLTNLDNSLGTLATLSDVGFGNLNATIIQDGKIKTDLLAADVVLVGDLDTVDNALQQLISDTEISLQNYADSQAGTAELNAQNSIAQQLGFINYAALVANAVDGTTLIIGGLINTDLITATNLIIQTGFISTLFSNEIILNTNGVIKSSTFDTPEATKKFIIKDDGTAQFFEVEVSGKLVTGAGSEIDGEFITNIIKSSNFETGANSYVSDISRNIQNTQGDRTSEEFADDNAFNKTIITTSSIFTGDAVDEGKIPFTSTSGIDDFLYSKNGTFIDLSEGNILSKNFSILNGNASFRGRITGGTITIGSGLSVFKANSAGIYLGNIAFNSAPFSVTPQGSLKSTSGTIGGWIIQENLLKSADANARIELNKSKNRVSIFDDVAEKVAMGYLEGLPRNSVPGEFWTAGDYGFWVKEGYNLVIDGNVEYVNGDWLIENDASLLIQTSDDPPKTVLRLGTSAGSKGLFIFDADGNLSSKFTSTELFIGKDVDAVDDTPAIRQFLRFTNGELTVRGTLNADDITAGTLSAELIDVDTLFAEDVLSQTATITGTLTASTATGKVEISGTGIKAYLIVPEDPDILTVNIPSDGSAPYFKGAVVTETNSVVDGQFITVNTITADKINVDNLSAIKADLGAVTAGSIVITQNNAENPPEPINRLWFNDGNDGGIAVGGLVKASAPFRLTNAGILTATSANITGTITATAGAIGGITIANNQINSTNDAFIVTSAGALTATSGKIGGWRLTTTKLSSGDANETRIELDEGLNRVSVLKADNSYAVVMGYLSGLPKFIPTWTAIRKFAINDVVLFETDYYKALTANSDKQPTQNETDWELLIDYSPNWDASNYGFWIAQGDRAVIDGDTDFVSGSWLVQEDASFLIQSGGATVARLGTYNGTRGLFFNEGATGTAFRSTLTPSTLYVGNDSSHLRWDGTNLIIKGNIRQTASGTEVLEPNIVGTWNSETPYDRGDVVLHPDGNRYIWTGTNGTVNISIPNANWLLFVEQGVQGIQGVQGDPAPQVISQYSADGATDWVNDFDGSIHKFIRISVDGGASYNITKIVGDQGIPGSVTEYQYAVNSSLTVAPVEADWKNTVDPVGAGQFLWTRIRVCIDGDCLSWSAGIRLTGEEGDQGEPGEPGNGIASTTTTYQLSANGTTPPPDSPTEDWLIAIPTLVQGQFLWTRVVITYTDNTTSTSYITSYIPIDGTNGLAGPGVVYRGTWAAGVQYIRNPQRADVVLFNGDYWIAKQTNTDVTPILGDNWDDFGATFTSVATGLLLTENAVVTKTISIGKDNTIGLVGDTDYPYITIGQGAQIGYDKTGIFIGQDNVATVAVPKLSLKSSTNSLLWDGTNLSVTGAVRATSGSFSGSISASTATFGNLALGVGGSFNSIPNSTNVGAVLGLVGGAGQLPNGWEYSAPVDFLSSSLTVNTANANDLTLNFTGDRTGEAGGFLQIFLMSNDNVIPTFGDVEWTLSLGAFSITQIVPDSILGSIRFILQELDADKTPLAENRIELHESATSITKITLANTRYLKVFFEINLTDILGSADEPNFNFTLTQPQLEQNPSRSAFQPTPTSAFIINSPNFKVTNTGVVTAVNGSFTGEITATSGSLGALNVGGTLTLDTTNGVIESAEYYLDTTEGIRIDKNSIALGFNTVAGTIRSRLLITQTGIYRDFAPGGDNEWFLKDDGLTLNSGQSVRIKNDTESTDLATGSTIIEGGLVAKKNARFGNVFVHGGTYHSSEGNAGITGFITTGGGTINYENGLIVSIT
jgi:hypothetical protein